jgi:hypothetical protein
VAHALGDGLVVSNQRRFRAATVRERNELALFSTLLVPGRGLLQRIGSLRKFAALALTLYGGLSAQSLVDAQHLDAARKAFNPTESAQPLQCEIKPVQPALDFSLRLQAGYKISIPLNQFHGAGHGWSVLLRVTPTGGEPVYLVTTSHLRDVPDNRADGEITGGFIVGDGAYDVAALVKDDLRRTCRGTWRVDAKLGGTEHHLKSLMPPNTVDEISGISPRPQTPPTPTIGRLTILLHALPFKPRTSEPEDVDNAMLPGMLSALMQQLPAREVRFVMFNLEQQHVLMHNDNFTPDAIESVSKALDELQLAKVDYSVLKNRTGAVDLLTSLVETELRRENPSDAVVFLGPHSRIDDPIPAQALEHQPNTTTQFFYLQYVVPQLERPASERPEMARRPMRGGGRQNPQGYTMRLRSPDSIEHLMKRLKGRTIVLARPRDFAAAISQVNQHASLR